MDKIVLASNNKNKLREINELFTMHGLSHITLEPIGAYTSEEPTEDGGTYLKNATIKARAAAKITGLPCLAEDSGIEIAALDSAPGVETAPWIASMGGWEKAMTFVNAKVIETGKSQIDFISTFVLALPDGRTVDAAATCIGNFTYPARGVEGFGHDPYFVPAAVEGFNFFIPDGETRTYAELGLDIKQRISPRAKALEQIAQKIVELKQAA